jgi:transcription initiation factor IIE alpha subunit
MTKKQMRKRIKKLKRMLSQAYDRELFYVVRDGMEFAFDDKPRGKRH